MLYISSHCSDLLFTFMMLTLCLKECCSLSLCYHVRIACLLAVICVLRVSLAIIYIFHPLSLSLCMFWISANIRSTGDDE